MGCLLLIVVIVLAWTGHWAVAFFALLAGLLLGAA